jgi:hypothetical protein
MSSCRDNVSVYNKRKCVFLEKCEDNIDFRFVDDKPWDKNTVVVASMFDGKKQKTEIRTKNIRRME